MWGLWIAAALAAPRLVLPAGEDPGSWTEVAAGAGLVFEPGLDGAVELVGGRHGWEVVAHLGAASAREAVTTPTDAASRAAALARGVTLLDGLKAAAAAAPAGGAGAGGGAAGAGGGVAGPEEGEGEDAEPRRGAWSEAGLGLALRPSAGLGGTLTVRLGGGGERGGLGLALTGALPQPMGSLGEGGRLLEVDATLLGRRRLVGGQEGALLVELGVGAGLRRASAGSAAVDLDVTPLLAPALVGLRPLGGGSWVALSLRPEVALLPATWDLDGEVRRTSPLRGVVELSLGGRAGGR